MVAVIELAADHPARALLRDNAIADDEDVILRRVQFADGRTRAFINDQPVSASLLQKVGTQIVEIHGQHDDRALVDVATHRAALDAFGELGAPAAAVREAWAAWSKSGSRWPSSARPWPRRWPPRTMRATRWRSWASSSR